MIFITKKDLDKKAQTSVEVLVLLAIFLLILIVVVIFIMDLPSLTRGADENLAREYWRNTLISFEAYDLNMTDFVFVIQNNINAPINITRISANNINIAQNLDLVLNQYQRERLVLPIPPSLGIIGVNQPYFFNIILYYTILGGSEEYELIGQMPLTGVVSG